MTFGLSLCNNHLETKDWIDEKNHGKDPTYVSFMARMDQLSKTVEKKMSTDKKEEGSSWMDVKHNTDKKFVPSFNY